MDGYAVFAQHFGLVICHASRPPRPYCRDAEPHCVGTGAGAFVTTISPLDTAQFLARTAHLLNRRRRMPGSTGSR